MSPRSFRYQQNPRLLKMGIKALYICSDTCSFRKLSALYISSVILHFEALTFQRSCCLRRADFVLLIKNSAQLYPVLSRHLITYGLPV